MTVSEAEAAPSPSSVERECARERTPERRGAARERGRPGQRGAEPATDSVTCLVSVDAKVSRVHCAVCGVPLPGRVSALGLAESCRHGRDAARQCERAESGASEARRHAARHIALRYAHRSDGDAGGRGMGARRDAVRRTAKFNL